MSAQIIVALFIIVIANLLGATLEQSILLLVTNAVTMVLTYYFSRNKINDTNNEKNKEKEIK